MTSPTAIVGGIMALLHRGSVSLELNDPELPAEIEKANVPYVRVTANGKTWQQPIRRRFGSVKSSPEEIAEALGIAVERCIVGDGPKHSSRTEDQ